MENNNINLIDKLFEYNLWANTQLIELCSELDKKQLEASAEGVFGELELTLQHIVRAEGGYLNRMTGSRPWADDLDWSQVSMDELLEKARISGEKLVEIAGQVDPATPHSVEWQGQQFHFFNWTVLTQVLYHGIEHRTQAKVILTQLGIEHPELDAWHYTESTLAK